MVDRSIHIQNLQAGHMNVQGQSESSVDKEWRAVCRKLAKEIVAKESSDDFPPDPFRTPEMVKARRVNELTETLMMKGLREAFKAGLEQLNHYAAELPIKEKELIEEFIAKLAYFEENHEECEKKNSESLIPVNWIEELKFKPEMIKHIEDAAMDALDKKLYPESSGLFNILRILNPQNSVYLTQTALVMFLKGDFKECFDLINDDGPLFPNQIELYIIESVICKELGEQNRAKEATKKAKELASTGEIALGEIWKQWLDSL